MIADASSPYRTIASTLVYENRWIRVREDDIVGPSGPGVYGVVEMRNPAVFVVALDDDDRICVVTLHRYPSGRSSAEVPAGGTDGEEPEIAARRELLEETGLVATDWTFLGRMTALNGIADAPELIFLARGLRAGDAAQTQAEEGITAVQWLSFDAAWDAVLAGRIDDGETIAAIGMAQAYLRRLRA